MDKVWDENFETWRGKYLQGQAKDKNFAELSKTWFQDSVEHKYSYQFNWLGIPIIQMPGDLLMFQDIVFRTKPNLIIETGVARGGSLVFWASIQHLCKIDGKVLGIDIDIRDHAIEAIRNSKLSAQIELIQGSSTDLEVFSKIRLLAADYKNVMVVLDSNHTHEHVMNELDLYADLVTSGCFLLVLDTVIDDLDIDPERNWGPGDSPKSAVMEYMNRHKGKYVNQVDYETRATLSVAPQGYWLKN